VLPAVPHRMVILLRRAPVRLRSSGAGHLSRVRRARTTRQRIVLPECLLYVPEGGGAGVRPLVWSVSGGGAGVRPLVKGSRLPDLLSGDCALCCFHQIRASDPPVLSADAVDPP